MRVKIISDDTNLASLASLIAEVGKTDPLDLAAANIVLVKDNFSLTFEKDILSRLNREGTFNVDVLSFSRLLSRLMSDPPGREYLTNSGGVMVTAKLLHENAARFGCYRSVSGVIGFAEKIYELITQLRQCGVSPAMLRREKANAPRHLATKLSDIHIIYEAYEKFLGKRYYDATGKLDYLMKLITKSGYLAGANLFLANFDSYTEKDYAVVKRLMAQCSSVTLCCVEGESGLYPNTAAARFSADAASLLLPCERVVNPPSLTGDFQHLAKHMFRYSPPERVKTSCVSVYAANDIAEEVTHIAAEIHRYVTQGKRYNRIGVVCQDLDGYRLSFHRIFSNFSVPFFLDDGVKLISHPAARYILDLADLKMRASGAKGWQFINLAKSPFVTFTGREADEFENYCVKFGVRYGKFYEEFSYPHAYLAGAEAVRKDLTSRLALFDLPKAATGAQFCLALLSFFETTGFESAIEQYRLELAEAGEAQRASYTEQVYAKFCSVLSQLAEVFAALYMTAEDFMKVLSSGLSATKISLIPLYSDSVFVGSINDCKYLDADILFVAGANDALLPVVKKDLNLLNEEDVGLLAVGGLKITPRLDSINRQERFNTFMTLLVPHEKLAVSYSRVGSDGRETVGSRIVTYLSDMFELGKPEGDPPFAPPRYRQAAYRFGNARNAKLRIAEAFQRLSAASPDEQNYYAAAYLALSKREDAAEVDRLYRVQSAVVSPLLHASGLFFPKGTASATGLETYYACPFRHFIACGLKAEPREEYGFNPLDSGSYLHRIVELYTGECAGLPLDQAASDSLVDLVTDRVTGGEKYAYYLSSKRQTLNLERLRREAKRVCYRVLQQIRVSRFKVAAREMRFGGREANGLALPGGVTLTGVIDRLDTYQGYCRIIDYKTGRVSNSLEDIYTGKKLQLYLYQQVMRKCGYTPAGTFYFPVHNEFTPGEDGPPSYRLIGSVLSQKEVLSAMDTELERTGDSSVLYLKRNASGAFKARAGELNLADREQLESLGEYSQIMAEKAVTNITAGDIRVLPAEGACKYCSYRDICNADTETQTERAMNCAISIDTITEAVKKWKSGR